MYKAAFRKKQKELPGNLPEPIDAAIIRQRLIADNHPEAERFKDLASQPPARRLQFGPGYWSRTYRNIDT